MSLKRRIYVYEKRSKSKKNRLPFVIGLSVILFLLFFSNSIVQTLTTKPKIVSPLSKKSILGAIIPSTNTKHNDLTKQLISLLKETKGRYGIYIKNLKSGDTYEINEHDTFSSASLYKLWVMATVYDQIHKGKLGENAPLSGKIENLNKKFQIASESAELQEGDISMTVSSALTQMITISHNYAALLLSDKVGLLTIQSYLKTNGLTESFLGIDEKYPRTTAKDTGLFFEKLYSGQLGDRNSTEKMLTLLKNQQLNNKLPTYLPENIIIAHKTGELDSVEHDAGIVFTTNGDYIIVVLSDTPYAPDAQEKIAQISKATYDYFGKEE